MHNLAKIDLMEKSIFVPTALLSIAMAGMLVWQHQARALFSDSISASV